MRGFAVRRAERRHTRTNIGAAVAVVALLAVPAAALLVTTALRTDAATFGGNAWAWGLNANGEVGDGTTSERPTPVQVHLPDAVRLVSGSVGNSFVVALDDTGQAWAWGNTLGNGTFGTTSEVPVRVSMPAGVTFTQVSAGDGDAVGLDTSGHVWEWGSDTTGLVLNGPNGPNSGVPVRVSMPADLTFTTVSAGPYSVVAALDSSGRAWTWGDNSQGELGDGGIEQATGAPVAVRMPPNTTFTAISAGGIGGPYGGARVAALDQNGHVWDWGDNSAGEIGTGTAGNAVQTPFAVPTPPGVGSFASVLAASGATFALDHSGRLWGWGFDLGGSLGDGTPISYVGDNAAAPRLAVAPPGLTVASLGCAATYCMALDGQGTARWIGGTADPNVATQLASFAPIPVPDGVRFTALLSGGSGQTAVALTGSLATTSTNDVSTIATSLSTPREAFASVGAVVVGAAIAAGAALFITFPSNLFNLTLQENYAEIRAWLLRLVAPLRRRRSHARQPKARAAPRSRPSSGLVFAGVMLVGALLGDFNDPGFGLHRSSLITYAATVLALSVGVAITAAVTAAYHRRRHGSAPLSLHALPAGLAIAAACVIISRLSGFQPGYLYGVVIGVVFARELPRNQKGHVVALTSLATVIVSIIAWLLWSLANDSATKPGAGWGITLVDDLLGTVFVIGLVGTVIGMLPLRFLPGWTLKVWRADAWAGVFVVAFFLLVQVMLRPRDAHRGSAPLATTIALFVVFGGLSIGMREYFAWRRRRADGRPTPPLRERMRELLGPAAMPPSTSEPEPGAPHT